MDDAVPSPLCRSQLRTACCVGSQASTSGVPTVLCSDKMGLLLVAVCHLRLILRHGASHSYF